MALPRPSPWSVRGNRGLATRGLYGFASFEEAQLWLTKQMSRRSAPDRRRRPAHRPRPRRAGARYLLIGGFAVVLPGGVRRTKDVDLLVDPAVRPTTTSPGG